ncbi:TonB-dependent receptor [Thalassotalea euphylliae]|uniref:TonB-dependent receptor n=1 Tax=Thalassotalea euphylliae TaxID=1655234 RepID=A0A3E0UER8_9GAMM|nr:TonB-dependent receptor [Thalassotalea euphylliae]REL34312.1 TonB-dependent receptor [Thalassotalea euphylliae]
MQTRKALVALAVAATFSNSALAQNVSGQIIDAAGKPVANAEVHVENSKARTFTNDQGQFVLEGVNKGEVELHVRADNFNHYHREIQVTDQNLTGLSISLSPTVMEIIDIQATPLHSSSIESALPISVLAGDDLRMKQASTLGETLKNEVGVHSSYYGPVASSPIIRGFDGPRVLITQNGLDVGDASRVGADHIVATETATATQIEVLRGPATLFYGSGAVGGVVNVVDERVPTSTDTKLDYLLQHGTVADEDEASFSLNTGSGDFALHLDGFWRDSNDYDIPGFAENEAAHDDEHEEEHEDEHEGEEHGEEEVEGTLANSAAESSGFTIGASYLLDNGFIGFSYGRLDREYGIPGHGHGHGEEEEHEGEEHEEEEEESVFGDLEQDRFQILSDLYFKDQFISRVASKLAYTDYQHQEIEGGEIGTTFKNDSLEARADVYHKEINGWNGAFTLHYKDSDFEALGEEAFTPPSETTTLAFAWLEEKHYGDLLVQLGARIEHVELTPSGEAIEHHDDEHEEEEEHEEEHGMLEEQSFTPVSASVGLVWDYQPGYNLGFSVSYSERAPSAQELFSNGPHIGTNTFEVGALYDVVEHDDHVDIELGDQDVDIEKSFNIDLTWRKFEGDFGFIVSAFYNQIDDYYYQQDTGFFMEDGHEHGEEEHEEEGHEEEHHDEADEHHDEEEGLPVFVYRQDDVDLYGVEAEFIYQVSAPLKVSVFTDYIRAELSDGGDLPRIPPMRIGSQFNYQTNSFAAELAVTHYFKQDDVAEFETETDSYTMVDANFNYYLDGFGADTALFIKGNNLTDEEARVHSSFLKDDAPLPGRNITVGIRGSF